MWELKVCISPSFSSSLPLSLPLSLSLPFPLFLSLPSVPANVIPFTPSPVHGVEGRTVILIFTITEDDPPVQVSNIRWQFSSTSGTINITDSTNLHYDLSADRRSLTIDQVTSAHHGQYTLFATNEAGTRFNSTNLIVQGKRLGKTFQMFSLLLYRAPTVVSSSTKPHCFREYISDIFLSSFCTTISCCLVDLYE